MKRPLVIVNPVSWFDQLPGLEILRLHHATKQCCVIGYTQEPSLNVYSWATPLSFCAYNGKIPLEVLLVSTSLSFVTCCLGWLDFRNTTLLSWLLVYTANAHQWLKCKGIGVGTIHSGLGPVSVVVCLSLAL